MFCGSELGIRWWSGKWWSGKLLSVWRMWMLHLDRPCGNVGTQVGGIICKHRQTFSNWFAHNLPTRNEQPSAAIAFGVLIDWISIFCRPRTFELQRSGDVIKTDVKFRRKSEPKKTNSNWIWEAFETFDIHFWRRHLRCSLCRAY